MSPLDKNYLRDCITAELQDKYAKMDGEELLAESRKPGMVKLWMDIYHIDTIKIFLHKIQAVI